MVTISFDDKLPEIQDKNTQREAILRATPGNIWWPNFFSYVFLSVYITKHSYEVLLMNKLTSFVGIIVANTK